MVASQLPELAVIGLQSAGRGVYRRSAGFYLTAMEKPEPPLERKDFATYEQWMRHCHEGGIDLPVEDPSFSGVAAVRGRYADRARNVLGGSRDAFGRAWAGLGLTEAIDANQLQKLYRAAAFANCRGVLMDTSVDITWSLQGIVGDKAVMRHHKQFFDAIRRWLERNGQWPAFLWVLERGSQRGVHTHALLHVPSRLRDQFRAYADRTLTRIVGSPLVKTPEEKTLLVETRPGTNFVPQWIRLRYMLKGVDRRLAGRDPAQPSRVVKLYERAGVTPVPQGEVATKRVGVSRALDDASFERWAALNDFPNMIISPADPAASDDRFIRWHRENALTLRDPDGADGEQKTEMEGWQVVDIQQVSEEPPAMGFSLMDW